VFHSKFVNLNEQVRAIDPSHAKFVEKLHRQQGVTLEDLQTYSLLTDEDFTNVHSPWYTAPVIVPINRDRFNIIHTSAVRYAKLTGTCVLRWRCKDVLYEQKPADRYMEKVYNNDPCFWEYFVVNAPASINKTINKELNLVNAMRCWQYSISMEDEDQLRLILETVEHTPPGSVIDIPCPLTVNIRIQPNLFTGKQLRSLRQYSIFSTDPDTIFDYHAHNNFYERTKPNTSTVTYDDNDSEYSDSDDIPELCTGANDVLPGSIINDDELIVVPILRSNARSREKVHGYGTDECPPFKVTIQQRFPIDLDFAITVNRSQGQTLDNVILAISKRDLPSCDFRYSGIYVAFSRVKSKENIRLLLVGNSESVKWESIRYITNLRPDPFCQAVLDGWSRQGSGDWLTDEWSSIQTRKSYEKLIVPKKKKKFYSCKQARFQFRK